MSYQDNKSGTVTNYRIHDISALRYGDHDIDVPRFPHDTILALVRRGLSHLLGNEVSSKVVAWAERETNSARAVWIERNPGQEPDAETEVGFGPSAEARAAKKHEFQLEYIKQLYDGTIGTHAARGPRLDPVESVMRTIAKENMTKLLASMGLKFPRKDEAVAFADQKFTSDQLLDRWLAGVDGKGLFGKPGEPNAPRIRKEAERRLAEKVKALGKVKSALGDEPVSAEALGF